MKLDQLRKIIREEVRAAIKEELQDVLTEAVKIASTPSIEKGSEYIPQKATTTTVRANTGNKTLDEMLEMTGKSMTSEDYRSIGNFESTQVSKPNFAASMATQMGMTGPAPGLDISQLPFIGKAKSILDASIEKDKLKRA